MEIKNQRKWNGIDIWDNIDIYQEVLFPYQKDVVNKLIKIDKHLIGLDMGLGKTITALAILQKRFETLERKQALILCQKTKVEDWVEDVTNFFPDMEIVVIDKQSKAKQEKILNELAGKDVIIITKYKTAINRAQHLQVAYDYHDEADRITWPRNLCLIVDESQVMKSRKSAIGKFGVSLANNINYVSLLSGDPISKQYEDLYNQLKILGLPNTWNEFSDAFCITEMQSMGSRMWPKIVGYKNVEALFELLHEASVLIKTEEVKELPAQNFYDIRLKHKAKFYKSLKTHRVMGEHEFETAGVLHMALRQASSGFVRDIEPFSDHKIQAVNDILDSTDKSFVIFYNFNQEVTMLKALLDSKKLKYYEINGNKNEYKISQTDKGRHIILAQYQSGSTGINLQHINYTIYYSPTQSGSDWKQSLKRTHRLGQLNPVFYYKLITKGTIEPRIYAALEKAEDYTNAMFERDLADKLV